mgnify:CR=1 FL=1
MDYETADAIKAELKAAGIDVVDRQGTWSALDGSIDVALDGGFIARDGSIDIAQDGS